MPPGFKWRSRSPGVTALPVEIASKPMYAERAGRGSSVTWAAHSLDVRQALPYGTGVTPPLDTSEATRSRFLGRELTSYGDRVAIVTDSAQLSYRELAARVARSADRFGGGRRLVLIAGANTVDAVVAYLGALSAGHPVLLAPGDNPAAIEALTAAYDPDVVVGPVDGVWGYHQRRVGSAHVLHPDLALLLSTSGSTGSPKLVRLSYRNLQANAEAIAEYLGVRDTDRAATTLPLHYCYGLSVLNSHLLSGAGLILTGLSVADSCFWDLFRQAGGTTFAGVPYTFTLLDRVGFDTMRLPQLRYVTQAGGRMAPDRVRHYAELGRRQGWDLFVMYGQTEATARMAYLPPDAAVTHPAAIGIAVPGGSLRLEPSDDHPDPDTGELVYTGPNVMLGYADGPADLALGRTVHELRTGDIARRDPEGRYEIVGRRSRFVKVFGLRLDLQRIEAALEADGVSACCVAVDDQLLVAVEADEPREDLRRLIAERCGLPGRAVRVVAVSQLPRLASGKINECAVADLARRDPDVAPTAETDLRALYAQLLDRPDATEDSSFVSLGGDSLSYVEVSLRLEQVLGRLPVGWHTMPIRDLRPTAATPPRRRRVLETSVALRAISIVLIVGSHIGVFTVRGGAHLLLAVAGFNFARFHLTTASRRERTRRIATSVARIAVPSAVFIALMVVLVGDYSWVNVFLLNEAFGPRTGQTRTFWFVETLVYILVALVALLAVPAVDRWERRLPFALPAALLALALLVRYDVIPLSPWDNMTTPAALFWFFALGWTAARAQSRWQRLLVAAAVAITVYGYFTSTVRGGVVVVGMMLLIWLPHLPGSALVNRVAGALASSSLCIYLTHWQVYPLLEHHSGLLALVASLAAGVLYAALAERVIARLRRPVRSVAPGIAVPRHIATLTSRRHRSRRARAGAAERAVGPR